MLKRISIFFCVFVMLITQVSAEEYSKNDTLSEALSLLLEDNKKPDVSSIGGEWAVIALARGEMPLSGAYYDSYYKKVKDFLDKNKVSRYTDYSRLILAIGAMGEDTLGIEDKLSDYDAVSEQGLNGEIFALIALNSKDYTADVKAKYLEHIINSQNSDGGFGLMDGISDVDVTAMALQALSYYRDDDAVAGSIMRAANYINDSVIESSESAAQAVIAFCTLNMIPDRYVSELMKYYRNGYFVHTLGGEKNAMACEQGALALAALKRYENGKSGIYDMRDAKKLTSDAKNLGVCPFIDVDNADVKILGRLLKSGIISGKTDTEFLPAVYLTRAEAASIAVRVMSLGKTLELPADNYYKDVFANDWFRVSVNTAAMYGMVKGVSDTRFNPRGRLKREELAVILKRLANYLGRQAEVTDYSAAEKYGDFDTVSDWARDAVVYCLTNDLLDVSDAIDPRADVTRLEAARAVYGMLWND